MRTLLSDNSNSFWHVALGVFAVKYPIIVPVFLVYQLKDSSGSEDTPTDIMEFMIPYLLLNSKIF